MDTIKIKRMRLTNFKGVRSLDVNFNGEITNISGRNASGKTTIADAFSWLLFGKDTQDRKQFDIKTLDEEGNIIPKIPHEVEASLSINGAEVILCRRFNEKWRKERGSTTEQFTGNEEERLYNGVPQSLKSWNEKINAICSEDIFKYITNPTHFVSQKTDKQREMLFEMVGKIDYETLAAGNEDFLALMRDNRSVEEVLREARALANRAKREAEIIPAKIDERQREIAELKANTQHANVEELQKEVAELQQQLASVNGAHDSKLAELRKLQNNQTALLKHKMQLETEHANKERAVHEKRLQDCLKVRNHYSQVDAMKQRAMDEITQLTKVVEECTARRQSLITEWQRINAEKLEFNNDAFICPTCKRPLDAAEIELKREELTRNFNESKASKLEENVTNGKKNNELKEGVLATIEKKKKEAEDYDTILNDIAKDTNFNNDPIFSPSQLDSPEYLQTLEQLQAATENLRAWDETPSDNSEIVERLNDKQAELDAASRAAASDDVIKRSQERIRELETQLRELADEIAKHEQAEAIAQRWQRLKIEATEKKINSLFSLVEFKMFNKQINGDEIPTCEATINGVPYSSLNSAAKINAGLDIINAISRYAKKQAPIFIDNSESVNDILSTDSQQIRLYVSNDNELTIK